MEKETSNGKSPRLPSVERTLSNHQRLNISKYRENNFFSSSRKKICSEKGGKCEQWKNSNNK